jgi:uncharacterized protein (TIGR03435 family)
MRKFALVYVVVGAICSAAVAPMPIGIAHAGQTSSPSATSPDDPKFVAFAFRSATIHAHQIGDSESKNTNPLRRFAGQTRDTYGGFVGINVTSFELVVSAYGVSPYRLLDFPMTMGPDPRYDVDAQLDTATREALAQLSADEQLAARHHMLQAFLVDRFRLKVRRETKNMRLYELTVAKGGAKFHESTSPPPAEGEDPMRLRAEGGVPTMTGMHATMSQLASTVAFLMDYAVLDKTGLSGCYDFKVQFPRLGDRFGVIGADPTNPHDRIPAVNRDWVPGNLEKTLGLRLDLKKDPVEVIVLEHIEKPTLN